jgi:interleukin-1 receptor-associated kinase 1
MALNAKLALLLTLFLSVASNGYSSLEENNASDDELGGRLPLVPSKELWTKFDSSFKSGFVIGYVFSAVSILTIFLSYCVPWARLNKRKRNKVMMKTPMTTSLMERQEKKRKEADIQVSHEIFLSSYIWFLASSKSTMFLSIYKRSSVISSPDFDV